MSKPDTGSIDKKIAEYKSKLIPDSQVKTDFDKEKNKIVNQAIKQFTNLKESYLRQHSAISTRKKFTSPFKYGSND